MGIFTDLGFKKRNGVLVAPDSEKLGGETLSTIKQSFNPPILVEDTDSATKTTTLPKVITQQIGQDNWVQYQVTANNVMGSVLVNGVTQTVLTSPVTNKADFFGDGTNIATYLFDGNVNDARGTYNGTATSVTYAASGLGQAAVFNGTTSCTTAPAYSGGDISISFWIKASSLPFTTGTYPSIWMRVTGSSAETNNRFGIYASGSGNLALLNSTTLYTPNYNNYNWGIGSFNSTSFTHIVLTISGNTLTSYNNGMLYTSQTTNYISAGGRYATTYPMFFGKSDHTTSNNYFPGQLDNIRIFNRVLNQTEVTALYNEGLTTFTPQMGSTNSLNVTTTGSVSEVNVKTWKLQ